MERPQKSIEQPVDKFDHELTQLQVDAIALADELLKCKPDGSPLSFIDIVLTGDQQEMLADIKAGPLASLLAGQSEQLAIESDGSYYPILDVRKEAAEFTGVSLRVWGWDHDKIRYTSDRDQGSPYEYKEYPDQKDKARQLEIRMGYRVGDEVVNEELSLYASENQHNHMYVSSQISMMAYAETGYEGHGGKHDDDLSDEAVEWFLDFVARNVGDQPKSFYQLTDEKVQKVRELAEAHGVLGVIDELIDVTWDAQALYLMRLRRDDLGGKSILWCLEKPETAEKAAEATRTLIAEWKNQE